jgi:cell division protein FtsW (lipid II flippase)
MRPNYLILILLVLMIVIGLFMSRDPERAERLSQMYRDAAFTGETRQMVLMLLALGIGAFIVYLTMTRR